MTDYLTVAERRRIESAVDRVGGDALLTTELLTWAALVRRDASVLDSLLAGLVTVSPVLRDGHLVFLPAPAIAVPVRDDLDDETVVVDMAVIA